MNEIKLNNLSNEKLFELISPSSDAYKELKNYQMAHGLAILFHKLSKFSNSKP